jgi:inorganic pyrophosphatase
MEVEVFIEIPRGSRNKYEFDPSSNSIRLDRVLFSSVHYPTDYGFIPGINAPDGDPLDVLVIVEEPTFPGCRVKARVIGVLHMKDEKGVDDKIIAVTTADPRFAGIDDISRVQSHWLEEIENFFKIYKTLEKKETSIMGWGDAEEANSIIQRCQES